MQTLSPGSLLQNKTYRIERVLGQGGFGITYLATDLNLQRYVAIKEFFPKDFCDRDETTSHVTLGTKNTAAFVNRLKAKFLKEARNIAKFDHPNIIRIYAAFEENNTAYYVMEYIEGESLSTMVKRSGPLPEKRALGYIEKVGKALEYVHARKINHLDVKPANIMVRKSDDTPILIDFGLSKQYDAEGNQTSTMPPGFSHGFAPLEQYNEGGVKGFSPQTDLYSLAATLYYLLSGVVPPQATKLIEEQLTFPFSIPECILPAISKAMSSARPNRHETIREFLEDIRIETAGKPMIEAETEIKTSTQQKSIAKNPDHKHHFNHTGQQTHDSSRISKTSETDSGSKPMSNKKWYILGGCAAAISFVILLLTPSTSNVSNNSISEPDGFIGNHGYVDLGLPSGIKWATMNIGANSPSDYGNYYAWGETTTKTTYTEENSLTDGKTMSKLRSSGIINTAGNLTMSYDAARANWGGTWRMPTKAEMDELNSKCQWLWTSQGGHWGYRVTGPNGKSIFVPVAARCYGTLLNNAGDSGYCWSSSCYDSSDSSYGLGFNSGYRNVGWDYRNNGRSVRPVSE